MRTVLVLPPLPHLRLHGDSIQHASDCPVSHIGRSNSGTVVGDDDVAQRVFNAVVSAIRVVKQQFEPFPVPVVEERTQVWELPFGVALFASRQDLEVRVKSPPRHV